MSSQFEQYNNMWRKFMTVEFYKVPNSAFEGRRIELIAPFQSYPRTDFLRTTNT